MFLEHVNVTVSDVERSADFYCRLFDFDVRWRGKLSDGRPAIHVGDERNYVALFQGTGSAPPSSYRTVGVNHFGFVVEDLAVLKKRLHELGITASAEDDYEPGRRLYFFDPDGVEIELVEYS